MGNRALLIVALLSTGCDGSEPVSPSQPVAPAVRPPVEPHATPEPEPELVASVEPAGCTNPIGVCCVAVQPLGPGVTDEMIATVRSGVESIYGVETRALPSRRLPKAAWYEPRKRWRADKLIDYLDTLVPQDCERIAGLTTKDISTTKGEHHDWGILGLGSMPGTSAVISTFRTRKRLKDVSAIERLRRVAIHEIGHTLGLPHCPTTGCFLEDAGGTVETVDRETMLCEVCRKRIHLD